MMDSKQLEEMIQATERRVDDLKCQGWTQRGFAAEVGRMVGGKVGGSAAVSVLSCGAVSIGANKFSLQEAGYIRALAGTMVEDISSNRSRSSGLGIDDMNGRRWLLASRGTLTIALSRGNEEFILRAKQILKAFQSDRAV